MKVEDIVRAAATEFLRGLGRGVGTVTRIDGYGSDWNGDTLGGFHSAFEVTFHGDGYETLAGEDLGDFWKFLMDFEAAPE